MTAHIADDGREQSVVEHIQGTAESAEKEAEKLKLGNVTWTCGVYHDQGKMNRAFEEYIRYSHLHNGDKSRSVPHSASGAHYIYYDLPWELKNELPKEIISVIIASHHGVYDCVKTDGCHRSSANDRWIADSNYDESVNNFKNIFEKDNRERISERILKANAEILDLDKRLRDLAMKSGENNRKSEYRFYQGCLVRLILSFLIYGDWKDTENFMTGKKKEDIYDMPEVWRQCLENYELYMEGLRAKSNGSDKIKNYRQEISQECAQAAEISPGVYRMSVPTGGGKTLSSMNFALRHSIKYGKERIFYISPFLSILEQNAAVIRDAIKNDELILEHHSNVADVDKADNGDNQGAENRNGLAIDWDVPIIVTTLVQFVNTLFSDKLQCIRRMHWLANSVIIIDEVQAIPVKCINTFNLMINFLAYICNATILLCTATQPALGENFDGQSGVVGHKIIFGEREELIKDVEKRFIQFERTRVIPEITDKGYGIEEACDFVSDKCRKFDSVLVILNTKSAVRKLFDNIQNRIENTHIYSLTTNMCPEHRSDKIKEIKDILERIRNGSSERILVISTSLIEAGVDISFSTVIRALSGLDSIVQAAGRCNRQGECEYGNVYIINTNENTGRLTDTVEGAKAAKHLINDLQKEGRIKELFMPEAISKYYTEYYCGRKEEMDYCVGDINGNTTLYRLLSNNIEAVTECRKMYEDKGKKFSNKINQAFKTAWSKYKMIDDDTIGVIVPYMDAKQYCENIKNAQTFSEVKGYLKKVQRYTVNVYRNKLSELIQSGAVSACDLYSSVYVLNDCFYDDNLGIVTDFENYIF